jgi:membrane fusion protein (multidrug efflux system)
MGDRRYQHTEDAYIQSDLTPIGVRVGGYVRAVPIQDFEKVEAGQLIAMIDDSDYQASYRQALANERAALASVGNLTAQRTLQGAKIRAAAAAQAASRSIAVRNAKAARRQRMLMADGAGSEEQLEAADAADGTATADVEKSNADRQAAVDELAVLTSQIEQARASHAAAKAAAEVARINVGYTRITAPRAGTLGQRQVKPGQYVATGAQITTLTPLPHVWVIANFRETQLTRIRPGQLVKVAVDAYPAHMITGRVVAYAPGTGSQFALLPPDNATGNFTKIVQRLAVKIAIDDPGPIAPLLRPGMSVIATIDTGRR